MDDRGSGWRVLRTRPPASARPRAPAFSGLVTTHALAMAGDTLITLALAGSLFFSISPTAARGRVALSLVLTMAPFAIVAPFLGPAIDRSAGGRKAMVVGSCLGRAVLCLAMAVVLDGLLLFPVAFAVLVLSKAYSVAKSSLVPRFVAGADELVEANAKLAITGVLAGFLAAGPGLLLLRFADARWVLRLATAMFVLAAITAVRFRGRTRGSQESRRPATDSSSLSLGLAAAVMALLRAEVGFLTFLVAFGFRRGGAPSWWFGVVLAASMAASLAGSATAPRFRRVTSEERILTGCLVLVSVVGLALARVDGRLWAAVVAAGVGFAAGAGKLAFDALVQRDAPDAAHGRSFARFEAGFQLVWVVGALLPVVVSTPLRQGYDVIGGGALAAATFYAVAVHRLRAPISRGG